MSNLNAGLVQSSVPEGSYARLDELEIFGSIASTNTHLLTQPAPAAGRFRVALADHQTSGRGRRNRRWLSPPGSGLCLSLAYTFAAQPEKLPALTLALGVSIVGALNMLDIDAVSLKWPNDIVALDAKLGGVLTEVQSGGEDGVTVVAGVGLNLDLPGDLDVGLESEWAQRVVDLKRIVAEIPEREFLAGTLIGSLHIAMATFEAQGFEAFADDWNRHDWLRGQQVTVDLPDRQVTGIASGVDADGALLVDTGSEQTRIVSGSIILAGLSGEA